MVDFADTATSLGGLGMETGTATTTVTAGVATVRVGDALVAVNVARDLTVAVGDVLLIARQGSARWAISRLFTAAPPAPPDNDTGPAPKPVTVSGVLVVAPTFTGSFRDGKWRTDRSEVIQGRAPGSSFGNNTGGVFYGAKPRSLAGATVTKATIRYRRQSGGIFGAQAPTLWLVTQASKPAGAPTRTSSTAGPSLPINSITTFVIPDSWAQAMVDGTSGGLAIHQDDGSPYVVTSGRAQLSSAWTLAISWTRTT